VSSVVPRVAALTLTAVRAWAPAAIDHAAQARAAENRLHVAAVYWLSIDGTDRQTDGYRAVTSTFTTNYAASINSIDTVGPTHTSVVRLLRPNLQLQVALDFHLGTTRR